MEQNVLLQEIVKALELFSEKIHHEMQEMGNQLRAEMQEFRAEVNERFDRLDTKIASLRVELTETQETVDFLSSKTIQHERKLRSVYRHPENLGLTK